MILEGIGEGACALLCKTHLTNCTGGDGSVSNWFYPNGTGISDQNASLDFYRTRDQMGIHMHRRTGGVDGIYHCEIPDSMCVLQTIYIGVYTVSSGE